MTKVSNAAELSRALRKALGGKTQAELAALLLVSRNYISQIESDLKEPSARLEAQMRRLLTEATPDNKVSTIADAQAPYIGVHSGAADLREEIQKFVELSLLAAGDDVGKLGWLREQLLAHFSPPPHWRPREITLEDHTRALAQELERAKGKPRAGGQSSPARAQGGAGA